MLVGANAIQVLAEGDYGDIIVAVGTVVFSGGIYNVRSITTTDNASVLFDAPSEIRVEGKVFTGKNAIIGTLALGPNTYGASVCSGPARSSPRSGMRPESGKQTMQAGGVGTPF